MDSHWEIERPRCVNFCRQESSRRRRHPVAHLDQQPIHAALFIGSYLLILVAHELGHAYVAYRRGYEVDAIGLTLLHGWCLCDAPQNQRDAVFIAWGGVAAQLAIALPVLSAALLLGDRSWGYLTPVIVFLGYLNVVIAIINLVRSDDSDGKVAWRLIPLLLQERRRQRAKRGRSKTRATERRR